MDRQLIDDNSIDKRTLKQCWWIMKDRRDWLLYGESPHQWIDRPKMAEAIQRLMDELEKHFDGQV